MATVNVGQVGSALKQVQASTVKEAVTNFGLEGDFKVKVNNAEATMNTAVKEGDFITIGEKVKGGRA